MGQRAADDQPEAGTDPCGRTVQGDGPGALTPSGKLAVSKDSEAGATIAAPMPCTARAAIAHHPAGARPISSDASENTTSPKTKTRAGPAVAGTGAEEQQATEDQCVGVLDPGELPGVNCRSACEAGQRGEDDRVVQQDHEVADEDDRQDGHRAGSSCRCRFHAFNATRDSLGPGSHCSFRVTPVPPSAIEPRVAWMP